jgi:RNA polymerase sigma factor (sigma-70 family)
MTDPRTPASAEAAEELPLDQLLDVLKPRLKGVLYRYRIPEQDAEDILQQTFLTLVYKRKQIRKVEPWLLATLKNRCIMYWRSRRSQLHDAVDTAILELVAEPELPEQERRELSHDLERVLYRLPDRCQSILKLRYGLGYKPSEVAEELGYKPSSIRKVTNRCLAALTRQLFLIGYRVNPASLALDDADLDD